MTPKPDRAEYLRLAPVLARALPFTGGTHDLSDVWTAIELGEMQMWPHERGIIITEVQDYPRLRAVHLFLAAGDMEAMQRILPGIETWARQIKASRITLAGRKGWERSFLAGRGYAPQWSVMARSLIEDV